MDSSLLEIDNQTVYFKSADSMDEIPDESVTLVVTSPPYWNVKNYGSEDQIGFNQSYEEYITSINKIWNECIRVLQPNGKIAINVQPLPISNDLSGFDRRIIKDIMNDIENFFLSHDFFLSGMNYWDKASYINNVSWGSFPKPTNIATNTSFEQIYTFVKRGKTRKINSDLLEKNSLHKNEWRHWAVRCIWDDISPVIKINSKGSNIYGHSAPFPEDIPYRLIRMHTVSGEVVLDPFLGSGTTLKICRLLGRKGIGYEINSSYRDKITERITEDWQAPFVDTGYLTLSYRQLSQMVDIIIQNVSFDSKKDENHTYLKKSIYTDLEEQGFISKAIKSKLREITDNQEIKNY